MKFDKTFIAIRERSILEIFDLSLHVMVDHFRPLFWLFMVGVTPWVVIDWILVGWLNYTDVYSSGLYYWMMLLLIISQAQVGTTFMTRYLGQAMFEGRPSVGSTVKDVFKTSPYFIWSHGFVRCTALVLIVTLMCWTEHFESGIWMGVILAPGLVGIGLIVRAFRPFVSEILLLERTPIRAKNEHQIHFSKRSVSLHRSASSDLFGRALTMAAFSVPLGFACYALLGIFDSSSSIQGNSEFSLYPFYWIAAIWVVAGFLCIVRFLSYIDIRIRQEGWAVELRMRAEGQRLIKVMD